MIHLEKLKVGQNLDREQLEIKLEAVHYQKTDFVARPGEYAVRGAIVDIYPVTYRSPVRLEFQIDSLASIRDFSLSDGESLLSFDELFLIPMTNMMEKKLSRKAQDFGNYEPLAEIKDLKRGDSVVHLKYGIGRFLGTKVIQIKGEKRRHLAIEYANREILYLEVGEPLERYIGGEGKPPRLTKLHGKEWERIKARTRAAVANVARQMLEIQAKRSLGKGFAFPFAAWTLYSLFSRRDAYRTEF